MKITGIRVFKTALHYVGGSYAWGAGNAITMAQSSVIVIDTDTGLSGCGEFCPCGEDPRQVGRVNRLMDHVIIGHGYAKAPIIAACWDILGKATHRPV